MNNTIIQDVTLHHVIIITLISISVPLVLFLIIYPAISKAISTDYSLLDYYTGDLKETEDATFKKMLSEKLNDIKYDKAQLFYGGVIVLALLLLIIIPTAIYGATNANDITESRTHEIAKTLCEKELNLPIDQINMQTNLSVDNKKEVDTTCVITRHDTVGGYGSLHREFTVTVSKPKINETKTK